MSEWQRLLTQAWEEAGQPSYRKIGRDANLNHESVRQAMNGSGAATRRTIAGIARVLCGGGTGESDLILRRWEQERDDDLPRPDGENVSSPGIQQFRRRMVQRRYALGLTQRQVGDLMGLHQPAIGELEIRTGGLHASTMARWAKALGVGFGFFVVIDGEFQAWGYDDTDDEEPS
jgi:plasmid maintenance system antidote protein VapI